MATISLERMISVALLVPMGNGDPNSGPQDKDCIWGLPLLLWGSPGIGKSQRVKQAGKAAFLEVKSIFPATRAPEDFSGVPVVGPDGKLRVECILKAVRDLCDTGRGVLFIDEISCAVPAVQASLLSVVLDRLVGDVQIPQAVRIIAAANPPTEAAGGWELEPPMANRFAHMEAEQPSAAQWVNWLLGADKSDVQEVELAEKVVTDNWQASYGYVRGLMAGFFDKFREGRLFKMPNNGTKERGRAWPSPRTWEMATRAVATCRALGLPASIQHDFLAACVGAGPAVEWTAWVKNADLPKAIDVVTNGWAPDTQRVDRTVAVVAQVTDFVLSQTDQELKNKYAVGAYKFLDACRAKGLLDIIVPAAKMFNRASLNTRGSAEVGAASRGTSLELAMTGITDILKGAK
jgi:hypothetical protein